MTVQTAESSSLSVAAGTTDIGVTDMVGIVATVDSGVGEADIAVTAGGVDGKGVALSGLDGTIMAKVESEAPPDPGGVRAVNLSAVARGHSHRWRSRKMSLRRVLPSEVLGGSRRFLRCSRIAGQRAFHFWRGCVVRRR